MDWYKQYRLIEENDGYTIVIDLNMNSTEFSSELLEDIKENVLKLDKKVNELVEDKFSDIKVKTIKLMAGGLIVASIPFATNAAVQAADIVSSNANQITTQLVDSISLNTTGVVTASKLNVRTGPATTYPVLQVLWQGNTTKVIGQSGSWYKIQLSDGRTGWVTSEYLRLDQRLQKINTVIGTAKSLLGTPYVWGGESLQEGGFDCSGFTQYVYKAAGINLYRISSQQATQGYKVSRDNLQPGDLVFFSFQGNGVVNHVGIYIGNGQMIHSPKTGDVVKVTDITTSYWQYRFVTAQRVIQ